MSKLKATITITVPINDDTEDCLASEICDALDELKRWVGDGFTSVSDSNEFGTCFTYNIQDEYSEEE